jgi:hypothetical protein
MVKNILPLVMMILPLLSYSQLLNYGGNNFFLNGPNIAWNNYGWDFGDNASGFGGGNGYDPAWWDNTFADVAAYGGNSVRVWVHCKAEHNPLFTAGKCSGLNNNFFENLDDMMQKAEDHNLMVILCLFDFHITDVGRQDLIKDTSKTNAYIKNALIPMVQHYSNRCNLVAWEIMNEPEWIMQGIPGGGNYGGAPVTITEMQRFAGLCAAAIHNNSSKYVTLGSASIKWCSSISPASGNYWNNTALKTAAYNNDKAYLDFYQVHYYDWMGAGLSPYSYPKSHWGFDKAVLIGETGNEGFYNYQQQFNYSYSNGYAGCMVWAYQSGGAASWNEFKNQMKTFADNNPDKVNFSCSLLSTKKQQTGYLFSIVNPVEKDQEIEIRLSEEFHGEILIRIMDMNGKEREQYSFNSGGSVSIIHKLETGVYLVILQSKENFYQIEKLIVQ